jgi:cytochrome c
MRIFNKKNLLASLVFSSLFVSATTCAATQASPNLGKKMTSDEIAKWSITVFADGEGLPSGQGTAVDGEKLYLDQCAVCHGDKGVDGTATRLVGPPGPDASKGPLAALSVGAWPYAPTIFDFIRRGMPHTEPKSLSDNEVYQLTAYILYLNDLLEKDKALNAKSLAAIKMPYADKTIDMWKVEKSK